MESLGSLVLKVANLTAVPAGDALAVDRDKFSLEITQHLKQHPRIEIVECEVSDPLQLMREHNCQHVIVASGPLTTQPLERWLVENLSSDDFYFYDAIAPVVDADTLDYSKLYYKDRHKSPDESADYLNAPMNQEQYEAFIQAMVAAEKVAPKEFEDWKFFESCLPIDLMAERGKDTARFSCMKPVGLELADGSRPYAVVQLRKENLQGAAFNLVGFQTRLTYKEQVRVFQMIPGLEQASFIHLGSCHRNTFLNARKLLDATMTSLKYPSLSFAGQITGVEGYTESAAMGLYVAFQLNRKLKGEAV
jgi:methylenetetrahydrofolate--tRNA-(uracil-5-)-methyltransferase